eukprot:2922687-Amphidinium_carterae.1
MPTMLCYAPTPYVFWHDLKRSNVHAASSVEHLSAIANTLQVLCHWSGWHLQCLPNWPSSWHKARTITCRP